MSQDYDEENLGERGPPDQDQPPDEPALLAAANRTNAPGIFLIVCGVVNLLGALYMAANAGYTYSRTPDELAGQEKMMQDALARFVPGAKEEIEKEREKQDGPPPPKKTQALVLNFVMLAAWLLTAILPILGGSRMRALRSYGLAVTGAIVTALPCLSCASCPCGLGLIFGIWALAVLLNPEVKNAFS
jgi:hypothetical protein